MDSRLRPKPSKPMHNSDGQLCINDLHQPILPWRFSILNALLALPMRNKKLKVHELVRKACKVAGLSDFGDEDSMPFREPLGVFLEDANAASTTPIGKMMIETTMIEFLVNRLKIVQLVKQHPEILEEKVDDPVVIVGVPRSGTTHLHRALARCSAFRSLKMFELMFPVEEGKRLGTGEKDPRLLKCEDRVKQIKSLRPSFFKLHHVRADEVEEELALMALTCQSGYMYTMLSVPRYSNWYTKSDKKPAYAILKLVLQVIQWQDRKRGLPKRYFLLKTPGHLESIPELMDAFPNAKLINTHRHLKPVLLSLLYLMISQHGFVCKEVDLQAVGKWTLEHLIEWGKDANDCQLLDKRKVINVLFNNYAEDNHGSIKKVLDLLKVNCSDEDWSKIEGYLAEAGKFEKSRVFYDPTAFGLDMDEVEEKLAFYTKFMEGLRVGV